MSPLHPAPQFLAHAHLAQARPPSIAALLRKTEGESISSLLHKKQSQRFGV
jgi:hypothetical protein